MSKNGFDPIRWQEEFDVLVERLPDALARRMRQVSATAFRQFLLGERPGDIPPVELPELEDEPDLNAGRWLTDYVTFASRALPMAPRIYHEALGLWILSAAVARRIVLRVSSDRIYPNLFILLVGPPSLTHKSSSIRLANRVVEAAGIPLLPPGLMTPEALGIELSTRPPANIEANPALYEQWKRERAFAAQRSWLLDEASGLFESTRRDYMAMLKPILLRWYDCPNQLPLTNTVGRGRVEARNTYLAFAGATTPAAMRAYFHKRATEWGDGTWARFALITHEKFEPFCFFPPQMEIPGELIERLTFLFSGALSVPAMVEREEERHGVPVRTIEVAPLEVRYVQIAEATWEGWERYTKAIRELAVEDYEHGSGRLAGLYGRLHIHAIKVAILLATADWADAGGRGNPTVEWRHWQRAVRIAEEWRRSLHRLERRLLLDENGDEPATGPKEKDMTYTVYRFIREGGREGRRRSEITARFHRLGGHLDLILEQLVDDGLIEEYQTSGRGRPGVVYRATTGISLQE